MKLEVTQNQDFKPISINILVQTGAEAVALKTYFGNVSENDVRKILCRSVPVPGVPPIIPMTPVSKDAVVGLFQDLWQMLDDAT